MRVEFKTDARNERSRAALEALPATFEGVFRKHMLMPGTASATRPTSRSSTTSGQRFGKTLRCAWQGRGRCAVPKREDIQKILRIRLGADRDRPGGRVRLLRRPGLQGAAGGGLRSRPRQLQPGDDHDRPRVRHPHLHRAAAARAGDQDHRKGAPRRATADPWRPDRAQHRDGAGRGRDAGAASASVSWLASTRRDGEVSPGPS